MISPLFSLEVISLLEAMVAVDSIIPELRLSALLFPKYIKATT